MVDRRNEFSFHFPRSPAKQLTARMTSIVMSDICFPGGWAGSALERHVMSLSTLEVAGDSFPNPDFECRP
jgi:hypothetical protein